MPIHYQYESAYFPLLAASAARNGVTPLIPRASNTTTRFRSKTSNFCNLNTISEGQKSKKYSGGGGGGGMPPDPPSWCATRALIAYWIPLFQNSRSATAMLTVRSWIVHLTPILGCSYHLHSSHRFLSTWGAVILE